MKPQPTSLQEMDTLLAYCERHAPGFLTVVQGASPADLQRIEQAAGRGLPPDYAAFLLRMGRTDLGDLGPFLADTEFGVDAALRFYDDPPVPIPEGVVYLGTAGGDCELFLPAAGVHEAGGGRAGPVLSFSWAVDPDTGDYLQGHPVPCAVWGSLFTMLYREAFERLRCAALPCHLPLWEDVGERDRDVAFAQERFARFNDVAARLGFLPLAHGDPHALIVFQDRPDAALSFHGNVEAHDGIEVHASDEKEASRIAEILADSLGLYRLDV